MSLFIFHFQLLLWGVPEALESPQWGAGPYIQVTKGLEEKGQGLAGADREMEEVGV